MICLPSSLRFIFSLEKIERTFNVNVMAHFWTIKSFLPEMINNKKGHIVTIASLAGHSGTNKLVDYCSSKFANVGMDEALKAELYVQGVSSFIKTTVVCPYYISTGMFAGVQSKVRLSMQDFLKSSSQSFDNPKENHQNSFISSSGCSNPWTGICRWRNS